MRHTFMVCFWICAGSVLRQFLPTRRNFCQRAAIFANVPQFLPTRGNFCQRAAIFANVPQFLPTHRNFCQRAAIFANVPQFLPTRRNFCQRAAFSREKRRNPWKSVKVWCTQRDKHGARYTVLISITAACLSHSF